MCQQVGGPVFNQQTKRRTGFRIVSKPRGICRNLDKGPVIAPNVGCGRTNDRDPLGDGGLGRKGLR